MLFDISGGRAVRQIINFRRQFCTFCAARVSSGTDVTTSVMTVNIGIFRLLHEGRNVERVPVPQHDDMLYKPSLTQPQLL
jgi:hypothetical protein